MAGVYQLEITESVEELKQALKRQKKGADKERVQWLYLLKSQQAQTMKQVAQLLGKSRVTVQRWAKKYREGGMKELLNQKPKSGRPSQLPEWAKKAREKKLQEEQGFESYSEIRDWLEENLGIVASYKTVHHWVHYRLKASPKVVRPKSSKQNSERREAYKKTP